MPKTVKRLSDREIKALAHPLIHDKDDQRDPPRWRKGDPMRTPVRVAVGGVPGLLVQVTREGSKSWILRTVTAGRRREIGLGGYPTVGLREAREKAAAVAEAIATGGNPIAARQTGREHKPTFKQVATDYIDENRARWSNAKHADQWTATLKKWVYPRIGSEPVEFIDKHTVKGVLMQPVGDADGMPFWRARAETASRVRQRIEAIMAYATAHDMRTGENPAQLNNVLQPMLPARSKREKKQKHHAALPWKEAPDFMQSLATRDGIAAQALQFLILTAARSGEVRGATWSEIDLERAEWTVAEDRMKAGEEHTVPLTDAAVAILTAIPEAKRKGLIFPGAKPGKQMSDMTLSAVLKRMKRNDITVHGFRSTFRDWAGETTHHSRDVIENALAHQLANKVEAAYARGKQLEKRRKLMNDWSAYLLPQAGSKVVQFTKAG